MNLRTSKAFIDAQTPKRAALEPNPPADKAQYRSEPPEAAVREQ